METGEEVLSGPDRRRDPSVDKRIHFLRPESSRAGPRVDHRRLTSSIETNREEVKTLRRGKEEVEVGSTKVGNYSTRSGTLLHEVRVSCK